jgi:hypothetical protein
MRMELNQEVQLQATNCTWMMGLVDNFNQYLTLLVKLHKSVSILQQALPHLYNTDLQSKLLTIIHSRVVRCLRLDSFMPVMFRLCRVVQENSQQLKTLLV